MTTRQTRRVVVIGLLAFVGCGSGRSVQQDGEVGGADARSNGACLGLTNCGGVCTDTNSDPDNCGGCGKVCDQGHPVYCPGKGMCGGGICMPTVLPGHCICDGSQVDPESSGDHCGGCGNKCDTANGFVCAKGKCACLPGWTLCGGECVDLSSDPDNCGGCGKECDQGHPLYCPGKGICDGGICMNTVLSGHCICNGSQVDPESNNDHCGGCDNKCDTAKGFLCTKGKCTCLPGWADCGGECVDLSNDVNNCGSCGTACQYGHPVFCPSQCAGGLCFPVSLSGFCICDGTQVDPETSNNHCGGCGNKCTGGKSCSGGKCV
jgi:hypothetical protein